MADRPLKYRELLSILRRYGVEEDRSRGKGSHRMLSKEIDGRVVRFPTRCHNEGDEKPAEFIRSIRRAFNSQKPPVSWTAISTGSECDDRR